MFKNAFRNRHSGAVRADLRPGHDGRPGRRGHRSIRCCHQRAPASRLRTTRTDTRAQEQVGASGGWHLILPAGQYEVVITAPGFTAYRVRSVALSLSQTVRLDAQLQVEKQVQGVEVSADAPLIEISNAVGMSCRRRELVDLPLNGRNFTQLGLLQPGVAPMTPGLQIAGGSLRLRPGIRRQRPSPRIEQLPPGRGAQRESGGRRIRAAHAGRRDPGVPDHHEHGAGGIRRYGRGYDQRDHTVRLEYVPWQPVEFLRNDKLDARNFFASDVEPLKQNQFGATAGGPIRAEPGLFFGYYEGFRNRQGVTRSATVPSDAQRSGDFSGLTDPQTGLPIPLINYFTGQPFPNNQIPPQAIDPLAAQLVSFYPRANAGPNLFVTTEIDAQRYGPGGTPIRPHVQRPGPPVRSLCAQPRV